jgi:uncharacterized membrane protein YjdF
MKKLAMLIFRILFLLTLIISVFMRQWNLALFYGIVFIITLFIPYLGRKDEDYYALDAFNSALFTAAIIISWLHIWPDYHTLWSFDKLFHASAGAIIAGFAAVAARRHVKSKTVFYIAVISFAIAVGAGWEVFEWFISLLPAPWGIANTGLADSMMDLIADTTGATLVALTLAYRRYL